MIFTYEVLVRIAIFVLGVSGFLVARHIYNHKKNAIPLVCPIKFDCNIVVNSDYSKFFGIPVEILGMVYYAFLSISYLFFIFVPNDLPNFLIGFMIFASISAFLFSLYLIFVQIFLLKKGCSWCFVSAFICILIFTFTVLTYDFGQISHILIN